jgi:small basic protein (TIGR04137 family)
LHGKEIWKQEIWKQEIWKLLRKSHSSVADARLAVLQENRRERENDEIDPPSAMMTFGQAGTLPIERINESFSLKPRTRRYWKVVPPSVWQSRPELEKEVHLVTTVDCGVWPAGQAKTAGESRYNNVVALLRPIFDGASASSVLYSTPAAALGRKAVKVKHGPRIGLHARGATLVSRPFSANPTFLMSQHRSLKGAATIAAKRNVLKRFERVEVLKRRGQWKQGDKVLGLRKTKPDA